MNLINLDSNYDPKGFFSIAVHDELREIDRIISQFFFTKSVKTENGNFNVLCHTF